MLVVFYDNIFYVCLFVCECETNWLPKSIVLTNKVTALAFSNFWVSQNKSTSEDLTLPSPCLFFSFVVHKNWHHEIDSCTQWALSTSLPSCCRWVLQLFEGVPPSVHQRWQNSTILLYCTVSLTNFMEAQGISFMYASLFFPPPPPPHTHTQNTTHIYTPHPPTHTCTPHPPTHTCTHPSLTHTQMLWLSSSGL